MTDRREQSEGYDPERDKWAQTYRDAGYKIRSADQLRVDVKALNALADRYPEEYDDLVKRFEKELGVGE